MSNTQSIFSLPSNGHKACGQFARSDRRAGPVWRRAGLAAARPRPGQEFVWLVLEGEVTVSCDGEAMINTRLAQLNHLISVQMNEIMHHPSFQKLEAGFIPLVHWKGTDYAAFFSVPSAQNSKLYIKDAANPIRPLFEIDDARPDRQLHVPIASRTVPQRLDQHLCRRRDDAPASVEAKNPLREAHIEVFDVPGKPGACRAVTFLRPHYQLGELSILLRLVADLPPSIR